MIAVFQELINLLVLDYLNAIINDLPNIIAFFRTKATFDGFKKQNMKKKLSY